MKSSPLAVIELLQQAQNAHDLEAFVVCFAPDYQSEQPLHPDRAFRGSEQVRKNWTAIFHDVPDFHSELLRTVVDGDTIWSAWHWFGTRREGSAFEVRGVIILGIEANQIKWGRLYMEAV